MRATHVLALVALAACAAPAPRSGILRDVPAPPEVMFLDDAFEDADFRPER